MDRFGDPRLFCMVPILNGDSRITSSATYSDDGNILVSTTDALAKVTQYGYNVDTNVLEWVQYPEDTEATRTGYSYDTMYRLASATADVDTGYSLDAAYTYADDLLTKIETNSTTYNFTYGDFSQISSISAGTRTLASYTYTEDANRYLEKLTYGNGDHVQYAYDKYGRVTQETFEDGDTVTYVYDNSGALATVTDSATGIKTTYYYDFTDRLMKYVESGTDYSHSVGYEFDSLNNLTKLVETINGVEHTTSYTYDEDNRVDNVTHSANNGQNVVNTHNAYDRYGRIEYINTWCTGYDGVSKDYYYGSAGSNRTSGRITNYQASTPNFVVNFDIAYDNNGNIISVEYGSYKLTYAYDSANQLIRENNSGANKTWVWTYDDAGNILSRTEYAYTTGELGAVLDTVLYEYGDGSWGDLLTEYDGDPIDYDALGNPIEDANNIYVWEHGRELVSLDDGADCWNFTYDANGMRTKRTNGTTTYTYVYNGSQLTQMTVGSNTLDFIYDASGVPVVVIWDDTPYYYVTTLQGDIQLIMDLDGEIVVSYDYDAWGNIVSIGGTMASTLGVLNPLTYRGYVYDHETGLYYLQSRYYNPTWGRFLNADAYTSTGQGLLGNNMFAYCNNNPVIYIDISGELLTPIPSLGDFYRMHKQVQYDIVEKYGYAMEVYVCGIRGKGFLDLFDAAHNQYYEVKSIGQADSWATTLQMEKYDVAYITDLRFIGYYFPDSPERGQESISGKCQYSYWDISYSSNGDGLITYRYTLNKQRYELHCATLLAIGAVTVVACAASGAGLGLGLSNPNRFCFARCY